MPNIKQLARTGSSYKDATKGAVINWFPGHMFSGMQAMIGKLNTTDAVIEVHDARIPLIGRNKEFREHLGVIKPRILVLNKADLADMRYWSEVKEKLRQRGDENIILTDLSGTCFSHKSRGYDTLLQRVVDLINRSDRHNRAAADHFNIMIVGIPNVGKSTLINRLRQHHLGRGGEPATVGSSAGVTKRVEYKIKICSRPLVYSLDTPGVLQPSQTKDKKQAMKLALCSNINDAVLDVETIASYLLDYLNQHDMLLYLDDFGLSEPAKSISTLFREPDGTSIREPSVTTNICWRLVKNFRIGRYGKVMFL